MADIQLWTAHDRNRQISIEGCQKATEELDPVCEPSAVSTRKQSNGDGSVFVWVISVIRDYANGAEWLLLVTFREQQGGGWALRTCDYGLAREGN